jgi:hypothetical protein
MRSVIIRIWEPPARSGPGVLRGVIEVVGTGHTRTFSGAAELIAILEEVAALGGGRTEGENDP